MEQTEQLAERKRAMSKCRCFGTVHCKTLFLLAPLEGEGIFFKTHIQPVSCLFTLLDLIVTSSLMPWENWIGTCKRTTSLFSTSYTNAHRLLQSRFSSFFLKLNLTQLVCTQALLQHENTQLSALNNNGCWHTTLATILNKYARAVA